MKSVLFNKNDKIVLLFPLLVISVAILSSDQFEERKKMFYLAFLMRKNSHTAFSSPAVDRLVSVLSEGHCLYVYEEGDRRKSLKISM